MNAPNKLLIAIDAAEQAEHEIRELLEMARGHIDFLTLSQNEVDQIQHCVDRAQSSVKFLRSLKGKPK